VAAAIFEFGGFRLDCGRFELRRGERVLKLERKPMELLILLAGSDGQLISRAEIAKRLWNSEVFVDTEHGINTAIRKIRLVLGDDPEEPRFVQTVTGMGYRFIASVTVIESEPVPLLSTGPGVTAEGEVREVIRPKPRHWRVAIGSGAVVLGVVALSFALIPRALTDRLLHRHRKAAIASLAVIPLENLTGDSAQDYFADGMTDELTTMLAKNSTLRITSRTSVMQYKGVHRPLREIAKELGVDGILEGSISRTGNQVHMTIQLIQAETDTHVWAESYDRNTNDIVSLPAEAAKAIAKRLDSAVAAPVGSPYVNPEAHDAYLHGRYLWYASQYDKAYEYFKKATELQPDYAPGWSGLSISFSAKAVEGQIRPADALVNAETTANKAIQLDDTLPEAHLALCGALYLRWDWTSADRECLRAIELDPKFAEAYHLRAKILATLNRHAEAIEVQKKATELDSFARPWALAYSYQLARQYDAALTDARQRLDSTPNDAGLHWTLKEIYRCQGKNQEATEELAKELTLWGYADEAKAIRERYRTGGYPAVLWGEIRYRETQPAGHYVAPVELALFYAQLKDREKTIALLEQGYREHSPLLLTVQDDPAFDFLHADGRYRAMIKGMGLLPAY